MKFNKLITKYKKEVQKEYAKYQALGSKKLTDSEYAAVKFPRLIFNYESPIRNYNIKNMEDLIELPTKIEEDMKKRNVPYYKMVVSAGYHTIKVSVYILRYCVDKLLDYEHNKYNFQTEFQEIVKIESGLKYINKIDCSIISMYKDNIISFEQMLESIKKC